MATETASFTLPTGRVIEYATTAPSSGDSGPGAPTVLLANSLCSPLTTWDRVVPRLAALGFRVLRYSPPGHGGSTAPKDLSSTTFDSLADDVRQLLAHLNVAQLHAWIGVSMGAATGVVFAARNPGVVARLVVCDTISCSPANAGTPDVFAPRVEAVRADADPDGGGMRALVEGTLERWFGRAWLDANPAEAERLRAALRTTSADGFETCCAALRSPTFDLRPLAADAGRGVTEGALLLVGENDAGLPQSMEELRRGIEAGVREGKKGDGDAVVELKVIKDAGHVCYVDGFEQFCEVVTGFLSR